MALIQIDVPSTSKTKLSRFEVIFALGFRPLYLAASIWAALAVILWIYTPQLLQGPLFGVWWHAHEMLWGFIATVAIAFLLTASATWTGLNPLKSYPLAGLCLAWLIARIGYLIPSMIAFFIASIADIIFFLGGTVALARVLVKAKSKQNYPLIYAGAGLGLSNAAYLYMVYTSQFDSVRTGFHIGLIIMTFIALLVGRRVIPFFAQRGANLDIPRSEKSGQYQLRLTILTFISLVLGFKTITSILLLVLGLLTLYQLYTWKPLGVRKVPLLWVLYISYFLLGLGLVTASVFFLPVDDLIFPPALFVHLVGMGGFSVMILGMMTRTALGHTGRPLKASRLMVTAYVLLILAVVCRLALFFVPAGAVIPLLHMAAFLWVVAFLSYAYQYGPYLTAPRLDGRPG
ncbi:NnrS family protein [Pelistega sp. NLN82]|uniref:NnrS family protein n=1 Tax=Pelistega ratti TaxID=2652177 RepID=A0A6L9Y772_9BURK|nr:NnrS family protein [Pelistega ratti]NEN76196.1 NnrS family protein [Pelistega ratti]